MITLFNLLFSFFFFLDKKSAAVQNLINSDFISNNVISYFNKLSLFNLNLNNQDKYSKCLLLLS